MVILKANKCSQQEKLAPYKVKELLKTNPGTARDQELKTRRGLARGRAAQNQPWRRSCRAACGRPEDTELATASAALPLSIRSRNQPCHHLELREITHTEKHLFLGRQIPDTGFRSHPGFPQSPGCQGWDQGRLLRLLPRGPWFRPTEPLQATENGFQNTPTSARSTRE